LLEVVRSSVEQAFARWSPMTLPLPPKSSFFCNFLLDESRVVMVYTKKKTISR
jgi:hypothetical protein